MLKYEKISKQSLASLAILALVLVIAYLPISSFLFALKNDAFTGYFPPKFFMSESISSGHLPIWNPYINYGFPQYGDMSSGYWNPITWLIASTVGYNAYSFTLETLLYIFLSGVGMYTVCMHFRFCRSVCTVAAISYMCSGYMVGHLQHFNWLSGAAFFPFCIATYLRCIEKFNIKNILISAIAFYFFISASHPGLSIAAFYFFFSFAIFNFLKEKTWNSKSYMIEQLKVHCFLVGSILLLSMGLIVGYLDIIPNFVRGEKIGLASTLLDPTSFKSWLSVLFPFATTKNNALFQTDISMRNTYIGITMLAFFFHALVQQKNRTQKFLLTAGIFFMLLSSGGIFKTLAYHTLPYIGYVRLNGEFLIFSIFCFILFGAFSFQQFLKVDQPLARTLKIIFSTLKLLCIGSLLFALIMILVTKNSLMYNLSALFTTAEIISKLKFLIDNISFFDALFFQSITQFIFCVLLQSVLNPTRRRYLVYVVAADLIFATLLNIPFTGSGQLSVKQVNNLIQQSPKGLTIPSLIPIDSLDPRNDVKKIIGAWSMYSKDLGTVEQVAYPIALKNEAAYFAALQNGDSNWIKRPFAFLANPNGRIELKKFTGNSFDFSVQSPSGDTLFIQQNFYAHWKYNNDSIPYKAGESFMAVPIKKGQSKIHLSFNNPSVKWAMLISLLAFMIYLLIIIFFPKRSSPSLPPQ